MIAVGKKAPDFNLVGDDGENHSLENFAGKWLVIYFYPKDMTPGCTVESCEFSSDLPNFEELNATVIGISKDSLASHARFKSKHDLHHLLLSDPDIQTHDAYGAYGNKMLYGKTFLGVIRTTVLVDPEGIIRKIWKKVRVKGHVEQVKEVLEEMAG